MGWLKKIRNYELLRQQSACEKSLRRGTADKPADGKRSTPVTVKKEKVKADKTTAMKKADAEVENGEGGGKLFPGIGDGLTLVRWSCILSRNLKMLAGR